MREGKLPPGSIFPLLSRQNLIFMPPVSDAALRNSVMHSRFVHFYSNGHNLHVYCQEALAILVYD